MFCVECGKEEKIFKNGVCFNCYIKNNRFASGPQIIDIFSCPKCSSFKYKNTWNTESFESNLKRHIKDNFKISKELKNVKIQTDCDKKERNISCRIDISGHLEDNKITEQHMITVRLKRTTCDICSKQYGGYFEAILQIRADKRKLIKEEIESIKNAVERVVENLRLKGTRSLFITDIIEEQKGIDFYLSEKGSAYTIIKKIQDNFGGEIKQSSTNIGMKDSKQIYRITYLLRLSSYRKGDFFSHGTSFYYISNIGGNKVHVFDLSSWTENVFDEKELKKGKIIGGKELVKEMILVSQSKDEIQFMDPKTYKTYEIKKPKNITLNSKMIKIVNLGERNFLFLE